LKGSNNVGFFYDMVKRTQTKNWRNGSGQVPDLESTLRTPKDKVDNGASAGEYLNVCLDLPTGYLNFFRQVNVA